LSKEQTIDIDAELEAFRDHFASTTKNPTCRDWDARFRGWVRRSAKRAEERGAINGNGSRQTAHERKTAEHLSLMNKFATDDDLFGSAHRPVALANHKELR
jgi:hypothetical protein